MFNNEELENVQADLDTIFGNMVYQELLQQQLPEDVEFEMENPNEEEYYDEDEFFNWKGVDDFDYDEETDWEEEEFSETETLQRPRYVTPRRMSDAFNVSMCSFWQQVFNALLNNDIMPTQFIPPEVLISSNLVVLHPRHPLRPTQQSEVINNLASSNTTNVTSSEDSSKEDNKSNDEKSKKPTTLPFKYSCVARDYYRKLL